MFTANSMNCLCEAIGMALPGNGTILATDPKRQNLYKGQVFDDQLFGHTPSQEVALYNRSIKLINYGVNLESDSKSVWQIRR